MKLLTAILLIMLVVPNSCFGAIAQDSSSLKDWASVGTTHTWAHTTSWSNLVLVVESFTTAGDPPDTVTFNGSSLTMQAQQDSYTGDSNNVSQWTIINPDVGTYNIVVTFAGSNTTSHSAVSYTGVDTTDVPHDGPTAGPGHNTSSADVTDAMTTTVDGSYLVSAVYGVDATRETGSMVVVENAAAVSAGTHELSTAGAGSHSMTWNAGGGSFRFGAHITIAIAPVGAVSEPVKGALIIFK